MLSRDSDITSKTMFGCVSAGNNNFSNVECYQHKVVNCYNAFCYVLLIFSGKL